MGPEAPRRDGDRGRARRRLATGAIAVALAATVSIVGRQPAHAAGAPADAGKAGDAVAAPSPRDLLRAIGGKPARRARFVEQRFLKLLDAPVQASGELRYQAPDLLEKRTDQPRAETMRLQGGQLTLVREGRERSIAVSQLPAVGALVTSLRDVLAGDADALEKRFRAIAQGRAERWQLVLLPSDPTLAELITRLVVAGRGERVDSIEILQADGDRSVMTLEPL